MPTVVSLAVVLSDLVSVHLVDFDYTLTHFHGQPHLVNYTRTSQVSILSAACTHSPVENVWTYVLHRQNIRFLLHL